MDDLNLLGWVVLKSDESMTNDLSELVAKLCATKHNTYCERLVNTDMDRIFLFLPILVMIVLKETMKFHFTCLKRNRNTISQS